MGKEKSLSTKHETNEETRTCGEIVCPIGCVEHIVDFSHNTNTLGKRIFASYKRIEYKKRIVAIGYILIFDHEIVRIVVN